MKTAGVIIVGACLALFWVASQEEQGTAEQNETTETSAREVREPASRLGFADTVAADFDFIDELVFSQSLELTRSWNISPDRSSVRFTSYEQFPSGMHETTQDVSASFEIRDIAPRSGNSVLVGGHPSRGGFLIEHWTLPDITGVTTSTIAVAGVGVGVPVPPSGGQVYIPGGGPQIPYDERVAPPPVRRRAVAEDLTMGYRAIGADPDGRFVLVVTDTWELRQFPLDDGSGQSLDPLTLADSVSVPALEHVRGLMARCEHAAFGRVWFLTWFDAQLSNGSAIDPALYETVVLVDSANDGVFESIQSYWVGGPEMAAFKDKSQWTADFLNIP